MDGDKACINCTHLTKCKEVDDQKLAENYYCDRFELAGVGTIDARRSIIEDLGPSALRYELLANKIEQSAKPRTSRRRRKNA